MKNELKIGKIYSSEEDVVVINRLEDAYINFTHLKKGTMSTWEEDYAHIDSPYCNALKRCSNKTYWKLSKLINTRK